MNLLLSLFVSSAMNASAAPPTWQCECHGIFQNGGSTFLTMIKGRTQEDAAENCRARARIQGFNNSRVQACVPKFPK